jgi:glucose/arabinose dehydrogenase
MALVGNDFYVANADALVRFKYVEGQTTIPEKAEKVVDLPGGTINHHWTKSLIANGKSGDALRLYVGVGSNSNVAERGMDVEVNRAAILEINPTTKQSRVFASGLRNPVGLDWQPQTGALWTAVNERDELGSDLVPDYMTSVKDGGFYGWPYSYFGQTIDSRVTPQRPELVATALRPDYALGAHTASLGLAFSSGNQLPVAFRDGAFIGQHGSWNRRPASGYKVIYVPFSNGQPNGMPIDVLTGFLDAKGQAQGRPAGVAIDKRGSLLVADDAGNMIWRVSTAKQ